MADGALPIPGVDYAFPPRPDITALAAAGYKFACRYGGPGTEDKWLHPDEAASLAEHGIWIVANAEGSADGLGNGWNTGASWASSAEKWFHSCGMPEGRPIYLSADFDVTADDWPAVADALRGAASVIGSGRVGVYGSYNVMRWAARDKVAAWFWQTYAWSAGRWAPGNHIEQYKNGVQIAGADCDLNRAMRADFGQWMPGLTPTRRSHDMWFGQVGNEPEVYVLTGTETRYMPPGTWETTIEPLTEQHGVPKLKYATLDDLLKAGGPLRKDDGGGGGLTADDVRAIVNDTRLTTPAGK